MLYLTGKLRVRRLDQHCLCVEALEHVKSKKTKQESDKWKLISYAGKLKDACSIALQHTEYAFLNTEAEQDASAIIAEIKAFKAAILQVLAEKNIDIN